MNEHDFEQASQRWLEEGPTEMPDRGLQAALEEIHATRQRPSWWPARRIFEMNKPIRYAIGAVAVVVAALIGVSFLFGSPPSIGGPAPTPTPTAAGPASSPTPIALTTTSITVPEQGSYRAAAPFPIPVTMTVPAGWDGWIGGPYAVYLDHGNEAGTGGPEVTLTLSQTIFADTCAAAGKLDPQPGPTVDDLAAALADLPGFDSTTPTDVTLGGFSGKQLTLTAPATFDGCALSADGYRLWSLPLGAVFSVRPGEQMALWILDVGGKRLVVLSETQPATTAQQQAEAQTILDSIHFGTGG